MITRKCPRIRGTYTCAGTQDYPQVAAVLPGVFSGLGFQLVVRAALCELTWVLAVTVDGYRQEDPGSERGDADRRAAIAALLTRLIR